MLPSSASASSILGITAYAVLGSADFGAGFWDLTAGGAERGGPRAGDDPALDEPGVGGQPRVADLRARDRLDGVPGRVRLDLLDARRSRSSWPRSGSSSAAPRSRCAARRRRSTRRACSARCSRSSSVLIPFCLGAALGGVASGRVAGRQRRRATRGQLVAEPDLGADRRDRACSPARYLAAVFLAGDSRARGAAGPRARVPRPRARLAASSAASSRSAACSSCARDARALFDGLTSGGGLAMVLVSGAGGRGHAGAGVARALRPRRASPRRSRSRDRGRLGARAEPVPAAAASSRSTQARGRRRGARRRS